MSELFSITSRTPSAYYDPGESCLKTSQQSLLSEVPALLEHLPGFGMTVAGALFALPTPERLTAVRDGSASLATPTAWLGSCPARAIGDAERWHNRERSNELSDQIAALLPTPTAQAAKHGATPDIHANGFGSNLWDLPHLLPTPTVNDSHNRCAPPSQFNRNSLALPALMKVLPTPQARDWKDTGKNTNHAKHALTHPALPRIIALLPTPQHWDHKTFGPNVDWKKRAEKHADSVASVLMNLPLNDGSESSDDEHLTQLTIEDCNPDSLNG